MNLTDNRTLPLLLRHACKPLVLTGRPASDASAPPPAWDGARA
jgi:hypothetical protein